MRFYLVLLFHAFVFSASSDDGVDYFKRFNHYYFGKKNQVEQETYRTYIYRLSTTGSAYDFEEISYGIDALNHIYKATGNAAYLVEGMVIISNVLKTARSSYTIKHNKFYRKSVELGWIDNNSGTYMQGEESQLYEGKIFKAVVSFIHTISSNRELSQILLFKNFIHSTTSFINNHVWKKWHSRSFNDKDTCGKYLLDGRTHMASHWATIALYLKVLLPNSKEQVQYKWLLDNYNHLLRKNMKPHPLNAKTIIWNSTWDEGWRVVGHACKPMKEKPEIQDMSHGNEVVSYIIKSHELGYYWSKNDIRKLIILFKDILWIPEKKAFYDKLSGRKGKDQPYYFIAEGYAKLGKYSRGVRTLLSEFILNETVANFSRQGCQLMAVLAANERFKMDY